MPENPNRNEGHKFRCDFVDELFARFTISVCRGCGSDEGFDDDVDELRSFPVPGEAFSEFFIVGTDEPVVADQPTNSGVSFSCFGDIVKLIDDVDDGWRAIEGFNEIPPSSLSVRFDLASLASSDGGVMGVELPFHDRSG